MMSAVTQTSASTSANASGTSKASIALDPNQFLSLLVAELKYQDPTKPMDTTQLVQQMSSLSQVEQAAQSNTKLASILDQLAVGQASLVGRTITSADGSSSGVVQSVRILSSGAQATLADGTTIDIGQGVTIR